MKRYWAPYFLLAPLIATGAVPNQYIVELSTPSVSEHVARIAARGQGRLLMRSAAAEQHRTRIRAEQATARAAIEQAEGRVLDVVENIGNALIVHIPDAKASRLAGIAGVRKIHPVREFHLLLDHALALHRVPDAWTQVGIGNAGAGMKIALIDSGIDIGHPGFQDAGFQAPDSFPRANTSGDLAFTNNKVIVARSYANLLAKKDPDPSPQDRVGHGTATAMAAAGVSNAGPLATISGVAPRAFVGNYKVFGSPGVNDGASESAILKALDDAVADGMDVISMSLGTDLAPRLSDDPEVQSLEHIAALGIVVVVAAGNNGPDPATVASPAIAPSVIAVGATNNDRMFAASVVVPGSNPLLAVPGEKSSGQPISAPLVDVARIDGNGLACSALPANALQGSIALILRGTCPFETKLNNAQAAGATAALVYNNVDGADPVTMGVGAATLPSEMIGFQDGLALKQRLANPLTATLQFALSPFSTDPARLADFSAKGPNIDFTIKPDLVAVGMNLYTAAQKLDPKGAIYSPDGYAIEQGTSFSTPLVAGAAALLKAARPGLSSDEYRSLLVNSAAPASLVPGTGARVQQGGAGVLDLLAALNATAAAAPVSISFGAGGGDVAASQNLTISNVGTISDTFLLSVAQRDAGGPVPQLPFTSIQLDPGASVSIPLQFTAGGLTPGQYEGYIAIQGTHSGVTTRVPYWYGVGSGQPRNITVLDQSTSSRAGSRVSGAVLFRITDESGLPVTGVEPVITPVAGGGRVVMVYSIDSSYPNVFSLDARLGNSPGSNVFQISVGDLTKTVTIAGN